MLMTHCICSLCILGQTGIVYVRTRMLPAGEGRGWRGFASGAPKAEGLRQLLRGSWFRLPGVGYDGVGYTVGECGKHVVSLLWPWMLRVGITELCGAFRAVPLARSLPSELHRSKTYWK